MVTTLLSRSRFLVRLLPYAVVFIASTCVMVVELTASRLIAPHVGASLLTWTSIIAVVLAGLSIGNLGGGAWADRLRPGHAAAAVAVMLVAAGAVTLLSVVIVGPVFAWTSETEWSLPARILLGVSVSFFAPGVVLGSITPLAATWAIQQNLRLGMTVGGLYAVGSVGAILGTLLTGFVLISLMGSTLIMVGVSLVLFVTALAVWPSRGVLLVGVALATASVTVGWAAHGGAASPVADAAGVVIYQRESQYQTIAVASDDRRGVRTLVLDNLIHGFILPSAPRVLLYPYIGVYAAAYEVHRERAPGTALSSLHLGGGAFSLPRFIAEVYGNDTVVVAEIDPAVTEASHIAARLPRPPPFVVLHGDAREVVRQQARAERTFDLVFADAFADFTIPFHLASVEFYREVDAVMAPTGVLLQNVIDDMEQPVVLASIAATVRQVHPHVVILRPSAVPDEVGRDTFVVMSSWQPIDVRAIIERMTGAGTPVVPVADWLLQRALGGRSAVVLTDDFAPVERLALQLYR